MIFFKGDIFGLRDFVPRTMEEAEINFTQLKKLYNVHITSLYVEAGEMKHRNQGHIYWAYLKACHIQPTQTSSVAGT